MIPSLLACLQASIGMWVLHRTLIPWLLNQDCALELLCKSSNVRTNFYYGNSNSVDLVWRGGLCHFKAYFVPFGYTWVWKPEGNFAS